MPWTMFQELLHHLGPHLEQQPTTMHPLLSVQTWVAITLLKLIIFFSLCYFGHLFRVGKVTTEEAVLEVCSAIQDVVGHTMLWVTDTLEMVAGFLALGFP